MDLPVYSVFMVKNQVKSETLSSEEIALDISLADLSINQRALILELRGTDYTQESLTRIGLVSGATVSIAQEGDPTVVSLNSGLRIGVRRDLLKGILVELLNK